MAHPFRRGSKSVRRSNVSTLDRSERMRASPGDKGVRWEDVAMRRLIGSVLVLASILVMLSAGPVWARAGTSVSITVNTTFDPEPDEFWATALPGCETGLVYDGGGHVQFTPGPGVFAGYKVFDCGSDNGFVLRLNARFGASGSVGTWSVVASWGSVAGMHGAGSLTGDPTANGILDQYEGNVVL
jgi:hypothetical protein